MHSYTHPVRGGRIWRIEAKKTLLHRYKTSAHRYSTHTSSGSSSSPWCAARRGDAPWGGAPRMCAQILVSTAPEDRRIFCKNKDKKSNGTIGAVSLVRLQENFLRTIEIEDLLLWSSSYSVLPSTIFTVIIPFVQRNLAPTHSPWPDLCLHRTSPSALCNRRAYKRRTPSPTTRAICLCTNTPTTFIV